MKKPRLNALRALAALNLDSREIEEIVRLLKIRSNRLIVKALLNLGKASAKDIMEKTDLPEATLYRALKRLREKGLIREAGRISPRRRGGPRTRIYALNWREP